MRLEIVCAWQLMMLAIVCGGWAWMGYILRTGFRHKYMHIPWHRRLYIIKNTAKSVMLASISPVAFYGAVKVAMYGIYEPFIFRFFGCVYTATDVVGLIIINKGLARSTLIHHVCVAIFGTVSILIDYSDGQNDPIRQIGMLGALSAMTWPVNAHLGLRFLLSHDKEKQLRKIGLGVYLPLFSISVAWQLSYALASAGFDIQSFIYFVAVGFIFYDDLKLISFLSRDESRMALCEFALLIVPCSIHWARGAWLTSMLELAAMVMGIWHVCFDESLAIDMISLCTSLIICAQGLHPEGESWLMFSTKAYIMLSIVTYKFLSKCHCILGYSATGNELRNFYAASVLLAAVLNTACEYL